MCTSDQIANFFLAFSHDTILAPLTIIGFLAIHRVVFGQALFLLLFTMVANNLLKFFFHIPLAPHLGEGFAFPSGHMQTAGIFYVWLMMHSKQVWLKALLAVIITGIAGALLYHNYHDIIDIIGALAFIVLTIWGFSYLIQKPVFNTTAPLIGVAMLPVMVLMMLYLYHYYKLAPPLFMALYALGGFSISWALLNKEIPARSSFFNIIVSLLFFFLVVVGIHYIFPYIKDILNIDSSFRWILISAMLPVAVVVGQKYPLSKKG